jgi:hypothetical protein
MGRLAVHTPATASRASSVFPPEFRLGFQELDAMVPNLALNRRSRILRAGERAKDEYGGVYRKGNLCTMIFPGAKMKVSSMQSKGSKQ